MRGAVELTSEGTVELTCERVVELTSWGVVEVTSTGAVELTCERVVELTVNTVFSANHLRADVTRGTRSNYAYCAQYRHQLNINRVDESKHDPSC